MVKYRINWIARRTGATGHGQPVFSTRAEAKETADSLNQKDKDIRVFYWVEAVEVDPTDISKQGYAALAQG